MPTGVSVQETPHGSQSHSGVGARWGGVNRDMVGCLSTCVLCLRTPGGSGVHGSGTLDPSLLEPIEGRS